MDESRATKAEEPVDPDLVRHLGLGAAARRKRLAFRIGGGLLAGVLLACIVFGVVRSQRTKPVVYETGSTSRGDILASIEATGTIEPLRTVEVGPDVSGRIIAVHADFNDEVTEGQVLVEIDPQPLRAQRADARARLQSARAMLSQAQATLDDARRTGVRFDNLVDTGAASAREIDAARNATVQAEAAVTNARAQIAIARAAVDSAETSLERTTVRSPINGIVLSRMAEPGQAVAASFQPPILFLIAEDLTRMELRLAVHEADIGRVRAGMPATFDVDAYPDRSFEATVRAVRNAPQTLQGVVTYEVTLAVDNSEGLLKPGMTATAKIVYDHADAVLRVPNAALRFAPPDPAGEEGEALDAGVEGPHVWIQRDGIPVAIPVERGLSDGALTEVSGDLEEGTEVLTEVLEPEE